MSVETYLGVGAIGELAGILETQKVKNVLIVAGQNSYLK